MQGESQRGGEGRSMVSLKGCSYGDSPIVRRALACRQKEKIHNKFKGTSEQQLNQCEESVENARMTSERADPR